MEDSLLVGTQRSGQEKEPTMKDPHKIDPARNLVRGFRTARFRHPLFQAQIGNL